MACKYSQVKTLLENKLFFQQTHHTVTLFVHVVSAWVTSWHNHSLTPSVFKVSSRKTGGTLVMCYLRCTWLPCIFSIGRSSVVYETEALFLDHGQSSKYLQSDKTYLLTIRCSLIALRLLLCLKDNCLVKAYQCWITQPALPLIFGKKILSQDCDDVEQDINLAKYPEI